MFGIYWSVVCGGAINNSETNGAPLARCGGRLKAPPTKPRENRAKRGVTRGISGWVSEPLVHLLASRAALPRTSPHTPPAPSHPETRRSSFISRAGMNSLMTNRTISFVESSQKYVFCGPFVRPLFIPPFVLVATAVELYEVQMGRGLFAS